MVASITRIQSPLNVIMNKNIFVTVVPKCLNYATLSKDPLYYNDFALHSDDGTSTYVPYLVFCAFPSSVTSLLTSIQALIVLYAIYVISQIF
jgi:hypothetical protein